MIGTTRIGWTSVFVALCVMGCGGGSSKRLTPEQRTSANAFCKKFASCEGVTASSSEMEECEAMVAGAIQIFPDPEAFVACVDRMSCSELEDSDAAEQCTDWDTSTFTCTDATHLTGCNHSGKCAAINCGDVCELMDGTFDHCGYDDGRGWDVCWCRQ